MQCVKAYKGRDHKCAMHIIHAYKGYKNLTKVCTNGTSNHPWHHPSNQISWHKYSQMS